MNTEQQRQRAEHRRKNAESERQDAEKQRNIGESTRQAAEKHREIGEDLRTSERTGERLMAEYSTRALLTRIERCEEQLSQLAARLGSVEALLNAIQEQLQQCMIEKE